MPELALPLNSIQRVLRSQRRKAFKRMLQPGKIATEAEPGSQDMLDAFCFRCIPMSSGGIWATISPQQRTATDRLCEMVSREPIVRSDTALNGR
jgi:histidine ammonia-lyase